MTNEHRPRRDGQRTNGFTAEQSMPPVTILHGPSLLLVMLIWHVAMLWADNYGSSAEL
jgi:hypothetical protein